MGNCDSIIDSGTSQLFSLEKNPEQFFLIDLLLLLGKMGYQFFENTFFCLRGKVSYYQVLIENICNFHDSTLRGYRLYFWFNESVVTIFSMVDDIDFFSRRVNKD